MGNERKEDYTATKPIKRFVLSYSKLSYKRKLIRTLWIMVFVSCIILVPNSYLPSLPSKYLVVTLLLIIGLLQAIYNYKKWKESENTGY